MELDLGISPENFDKKFIFHCLKERFIQSKSLEFQPANSHENIYLPQNYVSPSQKQGVKEHDEVLIRMHGGQMISQAGITLRLPITTIVTAQSIFQRFFAKNSFLDHDYREVCMGAFFLASKVDETFRKIWDVADTFTQIFKNYDSNPIPFLNRELTPKIREVIAENERIILKELGFELFRFSDQPHKFIASFFNLFKSPKPLVKKIWGILNDSYLTDLCVHFPPQIIAAGCIYLGMREMQYPMPQQNWWVLLEASMTHIQDVASTILMMYSVQERVDFKKVRQMLPGFRESYIDSTFLIKQQSRQSYMKDPVQDDFIAQSQIQEPSQNKQKKSKEDKKEKDKEKKKKEKEKDIKDKEAKDKKKKKHKHENSQKKDKKKKDKDKERSRSRDKEKKHKEKEKDKIKDEKVTSEKIENTNGSTHSNHIATQVTTNPSNLPMTIPMSMPVSIQQLPAPMEEEVVPAIPEKTSPVKQISIEKEVKPRFDSKMEMERIKNSLKLKKEQEEQQRQEQQQRENEEENKLKQLRLKRIARKSQVDDGLGFEM